MDEASRKSWVWKALERRWRGVEETLEGLRSCDHLRDEAGQSKQPAAPGWANRQRVGALLVPAQAVPNRPSVGYAAPSGTSCAGG